MCAAWLLVQCSFDCAQTETDPLFGPKILTIPYRALWGDRPPSGGSNPAVVAVRTPICRTCSNYLLEKKYFKYSTHTSHSAQSSVAKSVWLRMHRMSFITRPAHVGPHSTALSGTALWHRRASAVLMQTFRQ